VNCCPADHFKTTGEIDGIKIVKLNHRPNKKELEFAFEVVPKGTEPITTATSSSNKKTPAKQAKQPPIQQPSHSFPSQPDNAAALSAYIIDLVLKEADTDKDAEQVKKSVGPRVESLLSSFKNSAYANGFQARITR